MSTTVRQPSSRTDRPLLRQINEIISSNKKLNLHKVGLPTTAIALSNKILLEELTSDPTINQYKSHRALENEKSMLQQLNNYEDLQSARQSDNTNLIQKSESKERKICTTGRHRRRRRRRKSEEPLLLFA